MPIKTEDLLKPIDIYIDYPFEEVMFRRDHKSNKIYRKFYSKEESSEAIPFTNRLYTDALLSGERITKEEYIKGKKKDDDN